jgi:hypothetical protein
MYRPVLEKMVIAHLNNKLTARVNTGSTGCPNHGSVRELAVVGLAKGRLALPKGEGEGEGCSMRLVRL